MRPKPVYRGADVGHDFRIAEVLYASGPVVQLLLREPVEQVVRNPCEPCHGQIVCHVADELVHPATMLADNHRGKWAAAPAAGHAGIDAHFLVAHWYRFPKRSHLTFQQTVLSLAELSHTWGIGYGFSRK